MTVEVVLQHLRRTPIERPQCAVCSDVNQVNIRRFFTGTPFVQVLSVFIEHLDPMIRPVVYKHPARLWIDCDAVNVIEVPGALIIGWISFLTPIEKELAVLVELCYARPVVAIGHEHRAVRKPRQKCGSIEVSAVGARHLRSTDG